MSNTRGEGERCILCGYDMRAIPKTHGCPECGFRSDELTRVWYPPVLTVRAAVLIVLAIDIALLLGLFGSLRGWVGVVVLAGWHFVPVLVVVAGSRLFGNCLVLGPAHIGIRRSRGRRTVIPFDEIEFVSSVPRKLTIQDPESARLLRGMIERCRFKTEDEFANLVYARIAERCDSGPAA